MINFFRKIRHTFLSENKFSKYLLYAIGEIALVMIGILLALQVNNWNTQRIQKNEISAKYEHILEELQFSKMVVSQKIKVIDSLVIRSNKQILELLRQKNEDSVPAIYKKLKFLAFVVVITHDMPTTNEFMNEGYLSKIDNSQLKDQFLDLKNKLNFSTTIDDYARSQLNSLIEPYIIKNLNYAQVVNLPDMVAINTIQDPSFFFDNRELENLINLKIETDQTKTDHLESLKKALEKVSKEIEQELTNHP